MKLNRHTLPEVGKVLHVYSMTDKRAFDHVGHFTLIAPDPNSGHKSYSVIRIDYQTGKAKCIGRELPLRHARKIAKDGTDDLKEARKIAKRRASRIRTSR